MNSQLGLPGTAVLLPGGREAAARDKPGMGQTIPLVVGHALFPERLGFRADSDVLAKPLQLAKVAAVYQLIVLPGRCGALYNNHKKLFFSGSRLDL